MELTLRQHTSTPRIIRVKLSVSYLFLLAPLCLSFFVSVIFISMCVYSLFLSSLCLILSLPTCVCLTVPRPSFVDVCVSVDPAERAEG